MASCSPASIQVSAAAHAQQARGESVSTRALKMAHLEILQNRSIYDFKTYLDTADGVGSHLRGDLGSCSHSNSLSQSKMHVHNQSLFPTSLLILGCEIGLRYMWRMCMTGGIRKSYGQEAIITIMYILLPTERAKKKPAYKALMWVGLAE